MKVFNLKKYMEEKNISIDELVAKSGVPEAVILEILENNMADIGIMKVINIAYALRVGIVELIGLEGGVENC